MEAIIEPVFGLEFAPRVGDRSCCLWEGIFATSPRGVQLSASVIGAVLLPYFGGDAIGRVDGAVGVNVLVVVEFRKGDGDAGDSGLRNGDDRGEPNDRGEGLYDAGIDFG